MTSNNLASSSYTLTDVFLALWHSKWLVIFLPLGVAILTLFLVLRMPDVYRSEAVLAPTESGNAAAQLGQLGGIAALAGIRVNNQAGSQARLALDILRSRDFLYGFIEQHEPAVALLAATGWDRETNQLILDPDIYDASVAEWVREVSSRRSRSPSTLEVYEVLLEHLHIHRNTDTGIVTVAIEHYSPVLAQQWLLTLVTDLNRYMKNRDMELARSSLHYLEQQLQETQVEELRRAIYQLIEEQTKNLMLAQVNEEYVFQIIDRPIVPEIPIGPKRLLLIALAVLLSGLLAASIALLRYRPQPKAKSPSQ